MYLIANTKKNPPLCSIQLDCMEKRLNEKVSKLQGCQEKKLQLEENVQRLQPHIRDMRNTLEKYTKSMTVWHVSFHLNWFCDVKHIATIIQSQQQNMSLFFQSLADQETHLKLQIKELEANVLAAAPDKSKQKQMEKSLEAFKKGRVLRSAARRRAVTERVFRSVNSCGSGHRFHIETDRVRLKIRSW